MSATALDHLVVAAPSLESGIAWCEATLGVNPAAGGRHAFMGTHNRVLKIASEAWPNAYLEIIAVDPEAAPPARPRWFGLDEIDLSGGPRLVNLVARSTMLDMHRWGLITVGCQPGDPLQASRDTPQGALAWEILVRADGRLECGGALPTLIQWKGRHPAEALADSGVTLRALELRGISERARQVLRMPGVRVAEGTGPALRAVLATPRGEIELETR
ncbi:MAG: VOC family protein [Burkholderiales bacterium]|nr:VOC family protein [Burkholderiales bacterium]